MTSTETDGGEVKVDVGNDDDTNSKENDEKILRGVVRIGLLFRGSGYPSASSRRRLLALHAV